MGKNDSFLSCLRRFAENRPLRIISQIVKKGSLIAQNQPQSKFLSIIDHTWEKIDIYSNIYCVKASVKIRCFACFEDRKMFKLANFAGWFSAQNIWILVKSSSNERLWIENLAICKFDSHFFNVSPKISPFIQTWRKMGIVFIGRRVSRNWIWITLDYFLWPLLYMHGSILL